MECKTVRRQRSGAGIGARLAVIEGKLETVLQELAAIRGYIPARMVEHSERIGVLERNMRTFQWLGGVLAVALLGTFIGHVLSR
jgi:hypothetical protein